MEDKEIVCKHYFQVMLNTQEAKFHVRLISSRCTSATIENGVVNNYLCVIDKEKQDSLKQRMNILDKKIMYDSSDDEVESDDEFEEELDDIDDRNNEEGFQLQNPKIRGSTDGYRNFRSAKNAKHQLKVAVQQEEPIKHLLATATPFMPKGKQKRVSYADMIKQDLKDDVSRPSSPTPSAATSPKTISTVMTGYVPTNKDLTQEITVYDIPSTWSQLDTLNHLKAWGQVVAIKFKSQQKYVTVTVSIELNQEAIRLWNDGAWTAPLGGLPGVSASVNTATLYPENPVHSILTPIGCKAFKLIQDRAPATKKEESSEGESRRRLQDKALGGVDKLTILAEIRSMLRKLEVL
ncbi:hypothetical protein RhiirC2_790732 [Rhizophagus irregularis]|uniref:Uncharacterized protein n=1 Tax=Rhizophagus irregularis TaxID=588596 RepID=A0A2N1MKL8_9GLOM|nr:hypothetical protein RhiirC2_790732 [Rhizophagus irregularis]